MKTIAISFIFLFAAIIFEGCGKESISVPPVFDELESTRYFKSEVFPDQDLKIYGKWKVFDISGGIHGKGHNINFDYLVIKKVGIYGFIKNDSLLEFGKILTGNRTDEIQDLLIEFEKDNESEPFFYDPEKYVQFSGNDTLHLNSPCCDRYNYHFVRIKP